MLQIEAIELDSVLADPASNQDKFIHEMDNISQGTDVVVLPELFSTGYIAPKDLAQKLALPDDGQTMQIVREQASKHSMAISGSYLATDGTHLFNRAFFIEPSGESHYYDKRHLFMLSEEATVMTAGQKLPFAVRFRGWNISMMVCYDLRFPVWARNVGLRYDAMIIPANWPQSREKAWQTLLSARAIENQSYIIGCNRQGCDDYGCYGHMSHINDYVGNDIGEWHKTHLIGHLDMDMLNKFRTGFPAWESNDKFEIDI